MALFATKIELLPVVQNLIRIFFIGLMLGLLPPAFAIDEDNFNLKRLLGTYSRVDEGGEYHKQVATFELLSDNGVTYLVFREIEVADFESFRNGSAEPNDDTRPRMIEHFRIPLSNIPALGVEVKSEPQRKLGVAPKEVSTTAKLSTSAGRSLRLYHKIQTKIYSRIKRSNEVKRKNDSVEFLVTNEGLDLTTIYELFNIPRSTTNRSVYLSSAPSIYDKEELSYKRLSHTPIVLNNLFAEWITRYEEAMQKSKDDLAEKERLSDAQTVAQRRKIVPFHHETRVTCRDNLDETGVVLELKNFRRKQ